MGQPESLSVGQAKISFIRSGEGDNLVFLHAGVADKRMFANALELFSNDWQAIAYDRRGFGQTTSPDEPFDHVTDLLALLDHLGVKAANLVGCSQGGRIALRFALTHPDRVQSLTLIGTAVSGAPQPLAYDPAIAKLMDAIEDAESAQDIDLDHVNALECELWLDGPTSQVNRVTGSKRALFLDMNATALRHPELTQQHEDSASWHRLGEIGVPTLCLCGALDLPHLIERTHQVAKLILNAGVQIIPDTAHLPTFERDDACFETINSFLQSSI